MSRTTTREIVRVCADIAKLDRKGKQEVFAFVCEELAPTGASPASPPEPVTHKEEEK